MTNWHCIVTDNEPKRHLKAVKVSTTLRILLSQVIFVLGGIFWPIKHLSHQVTVGSNFGWWSPTEILALYSYPGVGSNTYPMTPPVLATSIGLVAIPVRGA